MSLNIIELNNNKYYLSNEVQVYDPSYFPGCHANTRLIINKKKLKTDDYIFAYQKNTIWTLSNEKYARAKLLLSAKWVENNVPKVIISKKKEININIDELYDVPQAPPILELEDHEKFKDIYGKTLNIEVRGERHHNKCYFKVKDISEAFDMPNLNKNIQDKNTTYDKDIDYTFFTIINNHNLENTNSKKYLFLTYEGIVKLLYISRNQNAKSFRNWATEKLFTIQMGTTEQKQELGSKLLGIHVNVVKQVFKKNVSTVPCIYLLSLNTVKQLRITLNIPAHYDDNMIVCKYGCTEDIQRRMKEHQNNYGKLNNVNLSLALFSYIDPKYIFDAESDISNYFYKYKLDNISYNELVIIESKDMKNIKRQYGMVQQAYSGHIKELLNKMQELETKIKEENLNHQLIIKDKDREIMELKYKNELLTKENIFAKRELELIMKISELSKN
jgi:hypothetical protein